MDPLSHAQRSERMSRIRQKDTGPELIVRRLVYAMGYRYRLHRADLPGRPDMAFIGRKKAIFVHGCFWHQHQGCGHYRMPKSRRDFWLPKLRTNVERDERAIRELHAMGWSVLVIWECQLASITQVQDAVSSFLEGD